MVWLHAFVTLAPTLVLMGLIYFNLAWIFQLLAHAPTWLLGTLYFLTAIPLLCQLLLKGSRRTPSLLHPWLVLLPVGPLVLYLFDDVGASAASWIPGCCNIEAREETVTRKAGSPAPKPYALQFYGSGNPQSFEFERVRIINKGRNQIGDMFVELPDLQGSMRGHPTRFVVTQDLLLEYVTRSDDFSPQEAQVLADELWQLLHKYSEKRDLPPMDYHDVENPSAFAYRANPFSSCLMTIALSVPILLLVSSLLAYWYTKRGQVHTSQAKR